MVCGGGGGVCGCFSRRGCGWGCVSGGCNSGGCDLLELNFVFLSEVVSQFGQVDRCLPSFVSCSFGLDLGWLRRVLSQDVDSSGGGGNPVSRRGRSPVSPGGGSPVSPRGGLFSGLAHGLFTIMVFRRIP